MFHLKKTGGAGGAAGKNGFFTLENRDFHWEKLPKPLKKNWRQIAKTTKKTVVPLKKNWRQNRGNQAKTQFFLRLATVPP